MSVSQVGGEFREVGLHVGVDLIPVQEGSNGKVVPQVMHAWAASIAGFA